MLRKTRRSIIAFVAAALFGPLAHAAPAVEAFGSLPAAKLARLSPDGHRLAVIRPINGFEQVVFLDLTTPNSTPYIVGQTDFVAADVFWKNNTRAVCLFHSNLAIKSTGIGKDIVRSVEVTKVVSVDTSSHAQVEIAPGVVNDMIANDPDHIYMERQFYQDRAFYLGLYRVNLANGDDEMVTHKKNVIRYLTDGYGNIDGWIEQDRDLVDHVILNENEIFKYDTKGGSEYEIEGLTAGNSPQVVLERPSSYGTKGLYVWSADGATSALFENPDYDVGDVLRDEINGRIIGVSYIDDVLKSQYFDANLERVQRSLENAFPGQSVRILSKDQAGSTFVILTDGPRNPPVLSLYTTANHEVNIIETDYEALTSADLGDVKPYPYSARDGTPIHAYLTLPPGRTPKNLPTVVFPHGGPQERDLMDFNWLAQFMASRGYAVLQPNFRGSSGYGSKFIRAGDGEWAGKVQYDVQDGVQKLVADGIADPKRICIVGASYGGYMALAGATFSPDLYSCAISIAGLSDLDRMMRNPLMLISQPLSVWKRRTGADVDGDKPASESPVKFAANVKIPILLIHNTRDTTVPLEQSTIEDDALKSAGKQVEFITFDGDDHYFEFAGSRIRLLKEVERFLAAHIGDTPAAATSN